jgi:hypothetical protein
MRTRTKTCPVCRHQTPNSKFASIFLRVNAQMHNLDKQKTAQIRQTLWASLKNDTADTDRLENHRSCSFTVRDY